MKAIADLLRLTATLRDPRGGCPWDREQTMRSLRGHSLDEIYELLEAIDNEDLAAVKEELGDLLFHIVFYAQIAAEQEAFDFASVAAAVTEKLRRRHPHVFAGAEIRDRARLARSWETIKQAERRAKKGADGLLDDVAATLPETLRAAKLQKRAAAVGFDWTRPAAVAAKVREELGELERALDTWAGGDAGAREAGGREAVEEEIGDLLFSCVNLSRHVNCDPELALRGANRKFARRFRWMERRLEERGRSVAEAGMEEMEELWREAKIEEG